ncbi:ABC transporter ATP-binding protein [Fluviicola taffensis]|uniref:Phosphonate-transporting ATPase n=1 Tax=Fluviicola taffensis (strain DSM 16823 / NCIMB 13979 / RW262) TaxID=755732 RepID=F2ICT7_FLUTR|nr:ATP-binding cassette domain-containing protein [Fluviicola taffensis]AEA43311.1 Phosphonate-transporting ATPase [Fluviicola taffensis DSM 16823]
MLNQEIILEVTNLSKSYNKVDAVKDVSFDIRKGNVYGLLGPNGSGKTTTLAMLMGILHPTQGSFSWFDNGQKDINRLRIGCLLETPNFYPYLNAYDNLRVTATIKNLAHDQTRIQEVLEYVDLAERGKRPFRTYSLGMKQRLAVAAAILSDPEVLVLDEPTNGLDPEGIAEMRELILNIASQGKTIILASHILDEVQKICSHVVMLKQGEMVYNGTMKDLLIQRKSYKLMSENPDQLIQVLKSIPGVSVLNKLDDSIMIELEEGISGAKLNQLVVEQGIYLSELHAYQKSLETIFLERMKL